MSAYRIIFIFILLSNLASAQDLIPRAELFEEPPISQVKMSPSGAWLSWIENEELYLKGIASGAEMKLTKEVLEIGSNDAKILFVGWSSKDKLLVEFTQNGNQKLLLYDPSKGSINHWDKDFASLQVLEFSRNGEDAVALRLEFPDSLQLLNSDWPEKEAGIFTLNLNNWNLAFTIPAGEFTHWYFDDKLILRAAGIHQATFHKKMSLLKNGDSLATEEPEWLDFFVNGNYPINAIGKNYCDVIGVGTGGLNIFVIHNFQRERASVFAVDIKTGSQKLLIEDYRVDLINVGATLDPVSYEPQSAVGYMGEMVRHSRNEKVKSEFDLLARRIKGDIGYVSSSANGQYWLLRQMNGGPLVYYRYDRYKKNLQKVLHTLPKLVDYTVPPRYEFKIMSSDGLALYCRLILPPGTKRNRKGIPDQPLPTVVYVHSGPWVGFLNNSWFNNRNYMLLADRGYAVIVAEFRGAAGYGRTFINKSNNEWADRMQKDLRDIAYDAIYKGVADSNAIAIWGWSYGGYATAANLSLHSDIWTCGMAMYGLYDLPSFNALQTDGSAWWHERVGNPKTPNGRALLKAHSPINMVKGIEAPLLLTHGAKDEIIPQRQTDIYAKALNKAKVDYKYFVLNNEPHDFRESESWESWWAIAELFLHKHLGGKMQPATEAELNNPNLEWIKP